MSLNLGHWGLGLAWRLTCFGQNILLFSVNVPEKSYDSNYKISVAEVFRVFVSWLDLIYYRLEPLPI